MHRYLTGHQKRVRVENNERLLITKCTFKNNPLRIRRVSKLRNSIIDDPPPFRESRYEREYFSDDISCPVTDLFPEGRLHGSSTSRSSAPPMWYRLPNRDVHRSWMIPGSVTIAAVWINRYFWKLIAIAAYFPIRWILNDFIILQSRVGLKINKRLYQ